MNYCDRCVAHQSNLGLVTWSTKWFDNCPYCGNKLIEVTDEETIQTQANKLVSLKHRGEYAQDKESETQKDMGQTKKSFLDYEKVQK